MFVGAHGHAPAGPARADPSLQPLGVVPPRQTYVDGEGYVVIGGDVMTPTEYSSSSSPQRQQGRLRTVNDEELLLQMEPPAPHVIKLMVVSPGKLDWTIGVKPMTSIGAVVVLMLLRVALKVFMGYPSLLGTGNWMLGVVSGALIALGLLLRIPTTATTSNGGGGGTVSGGAGSLPRSHWWTVLWMGLVAVGVLLPFNSSSVSLVAMLLIGRLRCRGWWMSHLHGEVTALMTLMGVPLPLVASYVTFSSIVIYRQQRMTTVVDGIAPAGAGASSMRRASAGAAAAGDGGVVFDSVTRGTPGGSGGGGSSRLPINEGLYGVGVQPYSTPVSAYTSAHVNASGRPLDFDNGTCRGTRRQSGYM